MEQPSILSRLANDSLDIPSWVEHSSILSPLANDSLDISFWEEHSSILSPLANDCLNIWLAGGATSIIFWSRQTRFCRDKTRLLSRQKYACRRGKKIVARKSCLSRQKSFRDKNITTLSSNHCLHSSFKRRVLSRQTRVCRNKTFVATKMILVAAPANDKEFRPGGTLSVLSRLANDSF